MCRVFPGKKKKNDGIVPLRDHVEVFSIVKCILGGDYTNTTKFSEKKKKKKENVVAASSAAIL